MSVPNKVLMEILSAELNEGDRLPSERVLAERCALSRTSIRNALKDLQSRGVLAARERSGYYLLSMFSLQQALTGGSQCWNPERIHRLLEARNFLGPHVAVLAAKHLRQEDLEQIEQCLSEMGKASVGDNPSQLAVSHVKFINLCQKNCPNQEYLRMLNEVRYPIELLVRVFGYISEIEKNLFFADHVNFLQALKHADSKKIQEIVTQLNQRIAAFFEHYPHSLAVEENG